MIKKLLLTTIFFIFTFAQATFAQELFKVTSVNFDTSNALVVLTSPDNTLGPILKNIKLVRLSNPQRAFFDIDSAVLTTPSQNWFFNSGSLKQIKVGQFSTNPSKIRVVMYFEEGFNYQKISFLKVNNNIIIKLKDAMCKNDYFQNVYREEPSSSSDVYENLSISTEEPPKVKIAVNEVKSDAVLNEIQKAFNASTAPVATINQTPVKSVEEIKKEIKLKSKYYVEGISVKPSGVLISGFGTIEIEKPMYLANPARAVFDMPNTILGPELKNKEFKISETESLKVGQYSFNKARVVITSPSLEKYFPIFSSDGQSLLLANSDKPDSTSQSSLYTKPTDAVAYYYKEVNPLTDEFVIAFNAPVVHGIKRDVSKLSVSFYNASRYNDQNFKNTIKSTSMNEMKIDLLPRVGLKLTVPLKKDSVVDCDLGADGKSFRVTIKGTKTRPVAAIPKRVISLGGGHKRIVLDPGHGGVDYGAIRQGINEKDINLDISKRVEAILTSKGYTVEMTRRKDETISLQDRTILCENVSPEIFVSIHVNSSAKAEPTGIETHYYHQESLSLAQTVHTSMASFIRTNDRGLFKSKFYVINHTAVPAILVEIGFLSNDRERAELVSEKRKEQTARAIADGIIKYLNK
jgi:N-acetylmuramoyl-L-alanine amidase